MTNDRQARLSTARILRGALLFVFAAAVILPFCTSFFLCAMPCCHRAASPDRAIQMPMSACPGSSSDGCAPEITAAVDHTTSTAAAPATSPLNVAPVVVAVVAPQAPAIQQRSDAPLLAAPPALHVLNSVFRI